jgi:hypothetical protein
MPITYHVFSAHGDCTQTESYAYPVRPDGETSIFMKYMKDKNTLIVDNFMSYPHVTTYTYDVNEKKCLSTIHWVSKPRLEWIMRSSSMGESYRIFPNGKIIQSYSWPDNKKCYIWGPNVDLPCPDGYEPCTDAFGGNEWLSNTILEREREKERQRYIETPDVFCEECDENIKYSESCDCDKEIQYDLRY